MLACVPLRGVFGGGQVVSCEALAVEADFLASYDVVGRVRGSRRRFFV